LRAAEKEIAVKTNAIYKAESAFTDKIADFTRLGDRLDKGSSLAELQKCEIIAPRVKLEVIKAPAKSCCT
jgi:hypothetical protein